MTNPKCNICSSEKTLVKAPNFDRICSECFSTSNERLFYENISNDVDNETVILYLNAKEALHNKLKNISKHYNSYSIDYNNNNTHIEDFGELCNIQSESIDIILSLHTLDKIKNDQETLGHIMRILKKGGKLLLKENVDLELEYKIEEDYIKGHVLRRMFFGNNYAIRCYGKDLLNLLEENNFKVSYEEPEKQEKNIRLASELIKDPLFICIKQ